MKNLVLTLFLAFGMTLMAQTEVADSAAASSRCSQPFSVGPTTQVYFSPGNLQYQPSTHLCRFAASQTEVLGWKPFNANDRYKGWIDLFGWGTATNPTNYSDNPDDYTFIDWGFVCGLPTGSGKMWRTLTLDEWVYLLSKRPHARRLYAVAYVDKHYGLILLPDNWKWPKGTWLKTGPKEDQPNWVSAEKWALLEAAGAVFLPSETKRLGTEAQGSASQCHYWTASPSKKNADEAAYLLVDAYCPQGRTAIKALGMSVRLVQEPFDE